MNRLMSMEDVLAGWHDQASVYQQTVTWDAKASRWETLPIPTWQGDPFLCMLDEEVEFRPDMTVLDIGCGSGVYGFAIAPRVRSVIGVDVSPKMIEAAERRAVVEGIDNVSFVTGDFLEAGLPESFDLVFAHMTPAIRDGETFKRMLDLASEYCYMAKPCRRTDPVLQESQRIMGIPAVESGDRDEAVLRALMAVWQGGMTPSMRHHHEQWNTPRTVGEALSFFRDQQTPEGLGADAYEAVTRYIESLAVEGTVLETIDTEIVMMGWKMR